MTARLAALSARIKTHLRLPLHRNAYSLVLSSGMTSALGFFYWILAARLFTSEQVGIGSLLISTMMFLASISQLNILGAMNRFLPRAGALTLRLIIIGYCVAIAASLAGGVIFILGVDIWAPALSFLRQDWWLAAWFVAATTTWCLFTLQDSVLVGLREAKWVPVENSIFALVKIAVLLFLSSVTFQYDIFASWTIPLIAIVAVMNMLIFGRFAPRRAARTMDNAEEITLNRVVHFVSRDYIGALFWMTAIGLLPIIVVGESGPAAGAHFYLAWTIAYLLYLVSRGVGMSLITEGVIAQGDLDSLFRKAMAQAALLVVPAVAVLVAGAPLILMMFGDEYAREGATLLRLLALSALPGVVTTLYLSRARVLRHVGEAMALQAILCAVALGLTLVLLRPYGLAGVGLAWLAAQSSVAVLISVTRLRGYWLAVAYAAPIGGLAGLRRHVVHALARDRASRWMRRSWPEMRPILAAVAARPDVASWRVLSVFAGVRPDVASWRVLRVFADVNETAMVGLGARDGSLSGVLKAPASDAASRSLDAHLDCLSKLHADKRLASFVELVPSVISRASYRGRTLSIEDFMPGTAASRLLKDHRAAPRVMAASSAVIGLIHDATMETRPAEDSDLARWIDRPVGLVAAAVAQHDDDGRLAAAANRLAARLRAAIDGRTMTVGWRHGDFTPGNILFAADHQTVTGLIDWETAEENGLPWLDIIHLLISIRCLITRRELGHVLTGLLDSMELQPHERRVLDDYWTRTNGERLGDRDILLLAWLTHVAANIGKSTRYARHQMWLARNVSPVLRRFA